MVTVLVRRECWLQEQKKNKYARSEKRSAEKLQLKHPINQGLGSLPIFFAHMG